MQQQQRLLTTVDHQWVNSRQTEAAVACFDNGRQPLSRLRLKFITMRSDRFVYTQDRRRVIMETERNSAAFINARAGLKQKSAIWSGKYKCERPVLFYDRMHDHWQRCGFAVALHFRPVSEDVTTNKGVEKSGVEDVRVNLWNGKKSGMPFSRDTRGAALSVVLESGPK